MAIITGTTIPEGPAPTIASMQVNLKRGTEFQMNSQFRSLLSSFKSSFASVWSNPNLTPQQVMDAFGTDAAQLFVLAGATVTMLNTILPGTLALADYMPPYSYTVNQDGTVTIGAKL